MVVELDEAQEWLFDLFLRREILSEFEEQVLELVKLCQSRAEYDLIKHTVEKLIVLNSGQLSTQVFSMAEHVRKLSKGKQTAVVAMAWDDAPDSSQQLVQMLKSRFTREDKIRIFNSVPAFTKKDHVDQFEQFILVDDFSGTGKTVENRYNHLVKHAKGREVDIEGYACLLFGMKAAFDFLVSTGINVHFCRKLQAGLSGHFQQPELDDMIQHMKRLEQELAPAIDGTPLPSMGHGGAEALFFVKDSNAPNSNFPIFWWPEDAANKERNTLMYRAEL
ncbi:hypothetical protein ACFORG_12220 [Lutimaribacter marinistellae]|uniref:PRTase-CE domain-containing protein n=1 Tax=Lutimaribacter marinistellae TaxID=1820329 RepID=A0ABV7TFY4_9RHOB